MGITKEQEIEFLKNLCADLDLMMDRNRGHDKNLKMVTDHLEATASLLSSLKSGELSVEEISMRDVNDCRACSYELNMLGVHLGFVDRVVDDIRDYLLGQIDARENE